MVAGGTQRQEEGTSLESGCNRGHSNQSALVEKEEPSLLSGSLSDSPHPIPIMPPSLPLTPGIHGLRLRGCGGPHTHTLT